MIPSRRRTATALLSLDISCELYLSACREYPIHHSMPTRQNRSPRPDRYERAKLRPFHQTDQGPNRLGLWHERGNEPCHPIPLRCIKRHDPAHHTTWSSSERHLSSHSSVLRALSLTCGVKLLKLRQYQAEGQLHGFRTRKQGEAVFVHLEYLACTLVLPTYDSLDELQDLTMLEVSAWPLMVRLPVTGSS